MATVAVRGDMCGNRHRPRPRPNMPRSVCRILLLRTGLMGSLQRTRQPTRVVHSGDAELAVALVDLVWARYGVLDAGDVKPFQLCRKLKYIMVLSVILGKHHRRGVF